MIALPAIHALARWETISGIAEIKVLTLPPGGELLATDSRITQVVYADSSNPRKSVKALLKCHFDLIVSDTNYDGIGELIQNSGGSRVMTNL